MGNLNGSFQIVHSNYPLLIIGKFGGLRAYEVFTHTTSFNEFLSKGRYSALGIARALAGQLPRFRARIKTAVLGVTHRRSHTLAQTHTGTHQDTG